MSYSLRQHKSSVWMLYRLGVSIIFASTLLLTSHAVAWAQCSYIGELRSHNSSLGSNVLLDSGLHSGLGGGVATQPGCNLMRSLPLVKRRLVSKALRWQMS